LMRGRKRTDLINQTFIGPVFNTIPRQAREQDSFDTPPFLLNGLTMKGSEQETQ